MDTVPTSTPVPKMIAATMSVAIIPMFSRVGAPAASANLPWAFSTDPLVPATR